MKTEDKFNIKDKVAIVIGGAGLLGKEFSRALSEYRANVVVADTDDARGKAAVKELQKEGCPHVYFENVDVGDKDSIQKMSGRVLKQFGGVDILVNCAAIDPKFNAGTEGKHSWTFEDYPLEMWNKTLSVNLTGVFLTCQVFGTIMAGGKGGVIVNIASDLGVIAPDHRIYKKKSDPKKQSYKPADYPVSKAAVIHLTKYLAAYWAGKNIRVNCLSPASVDAGQDGELKENIAYRTVLGRLSKKDEFNAALIFLVSDASSYLTGANLVVDGGRSIW